VTPLPEADAVLVAAIRDGLAELADPGRAPAMQAYMKSTMPYRGVLAPLQRPLFKRAIAEHPLVDFAGWRDTVLELWRHATFREERYAAIALMADRRYRQHRTTMALPLYEEMIVSGAWWDLVDEVAHHVGDLLAREPEVMRPVLLEWAHSPDLWKRRSAIICQVGRKREVDLELLYACIAPNLAGRDFFIRKAIGWALRDYAWKDRDEVRRYVAEHNSELSGLSRREALKNIGAPLEGAPTYPPG
jgi:3-methyladenine DNA glycosylase AlkD